MFITQKCFISSTQLNNVFKHSSLAPNFYIKCQKKVNATMKINSPEKKISSNFKKIGYNTFVSAAIFLGVILGPTNASSFPEEKPQEKVIDDSGVLTKSSISYIEKSIAKLKETYQGEVFFVSIRNLPYEKDVQEYAAELFKKWNLGENDILVLLANKIAKGGIFYGNQVNILSGSIVKSIGEETYPFKAKEEQYSSAAIDVSNRLISILSNKGDPGPPKINLVNSESNFKSAKNTEEQRSKYIAIIVILLIIAFVVPMFQFFFYVKDE